MLAVMTCTMLIRAKLRRARARAKVKRADNSDRPFEHLPRGDSSEHSTSCHPYERVIRKLMAGADGPMGEAWSMFSHEAEGIHTDDLPLPLEYCPWEFVTTQEQLEVLVRELSQVSMECWLKTEN